MIFTIQLFLFFGLLDFKGCALDYSETSRQQKPVHGNGIVLQDVPIR